MSRYTGGRRVEGGEGEEGLKKAKKVSSIFFMAPNKEFKSTVFVLSDSLFSKINIKFQNLFYYRTVYQITSNIACFDIFRTAVLSILSRFYALRQWFPTEVPRHREVLGFHQLSYFYGH